MVPSKPSDQPSKKGRVRYEKRDIHLRPLLLSAAGLAALLLIVAFSVSGLFGLLTGQLGRKAPLAGRPADAEITRQLEDLRRREDRLLNTYGWVSQEEGVVHIPIDRAIQLTVEEHRPPDEQSEEE